jgi:hypothetical protein
VWVGARAAGVMGNENSSLCCDGDNSREITEVRKISREPARVAAFGQKTLDLATHSGTPGYEAARGGPVLRQSGGAVLRPSGQTAEARHEAQLPVPPEGGIITPRPRSAVVTPDGASPADFTIASLSRPPSGTTEATFSHSAASPFAKKISNPRRGQSNGGRAQSSYPSEEKDGHSTYTYLSAQAPAGARGRTQSHFDPGRMYYEEESNISTSKPGGTGDYASSTITSHPHFAMV